MQAVCYHCFRYVPEGEKCPFCGYDPRQDEGQYRIALRPGTQLANRYVIGRVLGQGGFGVTYVALDSQTRARVAVKEYLPTEFVSRDADGTTLLLNSLNLQEDFEYGKQQFLTEAKTLAEFVGGEHIVSIQNYFEANGTAYFAMEFVEGVNLKTYVMQKGSPLPVYEGSRILMPIMEALDWVHSKGLGHRDIAPDNIMIRKDGDAKLIDFGAARYSTGEKSKSLDVVLKHGFAPMEQYSRRGRQGPFTDVYAMAATYYYAITGKAPAEAPDRAADAELVPPSALGAKIRKDTEQVLIKALSLSAQDRYQKMSEFYSALLKTMPHPFEPDGGGKKKPPFTAIAAVLAAALLGVAVGSCVLKPNPPAPATEPAETSEPAEQTETTPPETTPDTTAPAAEETPAGEQIPGTPAPQATTEAESPSPVIITGEIPTAQSPSPEPEPAPSEADLRAINSGIEYPRADEYFDRYVYAVVRAPHGHSVLGFGTARHDGNSYTVLDGEEVIILAERKGYSCCIVVSQQKARWINSEYLVPTE